MKKLKLLILLSLNCYIFSQFDAYKNINILEKKLDGWFGPINRKKLAELIKEHDPKIIVELGSWLGVSTVFMAKNMNQNGVLYAIDVWQETKECKIALNIRPQSKDNIFDYLYQQFLSNMIHENVSHIVNPIKETTIKASKLLNIEPDMVYVDASHAEEDVYNDIKFWYEKLKKGGIMCGDDFNWLTVKAALSRIVPELNQTLYTYGNFWLLEPKN